MKISNLIANVTGKYGTAVIDAAKFIVCGLAACAIGKYVFDPVKEDTRAELLERGYTSEEISQAENMVRDRVIDGIKDAFSRSGEKLPFAEAATTAGAISKEQLQEA